MFQNMSSTRQPGCQWRLNRAIDTIRHLFDAYIAACILIFVSPLILLGVVGIILTSPGPVFFTARRIGRDRRQALRSETPPMSRRWERRKPGYSAREFTIYKLRTMHLHASGGSPITAENDARVFRFGKFLRATKIDELPQLVNVIRGDMAIIGPRPEAPEIVHAYYRISDVDTLRVRPGLTSPGTLYYYTHCEAMLR
jgi:lipopolysaccharide/colanic/teichoic acid biosynthesis glycosyltransferase